MKWNLCGALAAMVLAAGQPAAAQPVDDATVASARALGQEGLAAYDAEDYAEAAEKLGAAFNATRVPTLGLWLARALAKTGRLVEASERYGEVLRLSVQPGQQEETQRQAKADAAKELAALRPRIPTLVVQVSGADAKDVEVTVDDAKVPSSLLVVPRPVNPGTRVVTGKLGTQEVTESVTLAEGEKQTVELKLGASAPTAEPATAATGPEPEHVSDESPDTEDQAVADAEEQPDSLQRLGAYASLGVGGVGLLLGSITGVMVLSKKAKLEDEGCVDYHCYTSQKDDVDSINSLRTISTVGFVLGGVGLAAGVTLLLTEPKAKETVALRIGPTSAGISGRF